MSDEPKFKQAFNIIMNFNSPNKATTVDGYDVERQEKLWIPEWGAFVTCASYDNHFVFEHPNKKRKGTIYLCTCGSAAIVPGYSGYKGDSSNVGALFVCLLHSASGKHADGSN